MLKIGLLASGNGSNAQAIIDKVKAGFLEVEIALIAGNCPEAFVFERAKQAKIKTFALDHQKFSKRELFDQELSTALKDAGVELVVLAGYMRLLSSQFLEAFKGQVINVHPALLPAFPGVHGARDAINWGVKLTGCTVHFVEEEMDTGSPIVQGATFVLPEDSPEILQKRIQSLEHRLYPQAIQWLATNRLERKGRMVVLKDANIAKAELSPNSLVYPPLEKGF